jgi:hypothetical protein
MYRNIVFRSVTPISDFMFDPFTATKRSELIKNLSHIARSSRYRTLTIRTVIQLVGLSSPRTSTGLAEAFRWDSIIGNTTGEIVDVFSFGQP